MPVIEYERADQVPEAFRGIIKEVGGKVTINVVSEDKLAEFRENNVKLASERDGLKAHVARASQILGTDNWDEAEKSVGDLRTLETRVKNNELVAKVGVDETIAQRTAEMKAAHAAQIQERANEANAWKQKFTDLDARHRRGVIEREVTKVALDDKVGIESYALPDLLERAAKTFVVGDDGSMKAMKGDTVLYGEDGTSPMSAQEWVLKLRESAPHFFKGSKGGGSSAGGLHGISGADLSKMSPEQKIALVNEGKR